MFGLGLLEIAIVAAIFIVFFGFSKLPQLGKGLGETISAFKNALHEDKKPDKIEKS